ncbi:MAG: hypothetical protein RI894_2279 [Bacteroidota bacterium]
MTINLFLQTLIPNKIKKTYNIFYISKTIEIICCKKNIAYCQKQYATLQKKHRILPKAMCDSAKKTSHTAKSNMRH